MLGKSSGSWVRSWLGWKLDDKIDKWKWCIKSKANQCWKRYIKKANIDFKLGTQIPIDENFVIDLYEYPKLIDLNSGEIRQRFENINSGKQDLAIIHHIKKVPPIAIDRLNKRIAIGNGNKI